jgi:hypothetical protein
MTDDEFLEMPLTEGKPAEQLTDWENPPKVSDLKADYQAAESDKNSHLADVDRWMAYRDITGEAKPNKRTGYSSVQPKLIRKQAEWRYAALSEPFLTTQDLFDVTPVTYEDKRSAVQNALVLNNQVSTKIDKVAFIDEYIRTGVDEGSVIIRTGWAFSEEERERPKFKFLVNQSPEYLQHLQGMMQRAQQDPEGFEASTTQEMKDALQLSMEKQLPIEPVADGTEMVMVTIKNHPTWDVCDYKNLTIDPTCKGIIDNAGFIIHSTETSMSELKADGRYQNLDSIVGRSSTLADTTYERDNESSFEFKDKPRQKMVLHEYWGYWDINKTGIVKPIVAAYVDDVMIRLDENPFDDKKLPFTLVQMLPKRKSNYGEPDAELIIDNQKIIGATTRGMVDVMARSANAQQGYAKGVFDVTNKRKFQQGEDYEYNPTINPESAFHMHKFPELPQSAALMVQSQVADAESLTGVRPFAQSQTGAIGSDTATGVKSAMDATSKRDTGILRRFVEGLTKIGRKTIAMNQQFLTEDEVIRVTNNEFVVVKPDDLAGNFDLRLTISTAEEDDNKAQQLAFMLQTIGNNMDPSMTNMILAEIATLRKMPALAQKISTFQPQPDPVQEQLQQLEMQKLQAEIAVLQSEAKENQAEAQLDMAKSQTEGAKVETEAAKARETHSKADALDQGYLDTEAGTTQKRDLDKISQQAESQTQTKMVEASLKRKGELQDRLLDLKD